MQAYQRLDILRQETVLLKENIERSTSDSVTIPQTRSISSLELQVELKHRQEVPVTKVVSSLKPYSPSLHSNRTFMTSVPSTANDSSVVFDQHSHSLEEPSLTHPPFHHSGSIVIASSSSSHTPSTVQLSRIMSRVSTRQSIVFRDSLNQSHVEFKALARLRSNRLSVHDNAARCNNFVEFCLH